MEDDADRVATTRAEPADAVAHVDAVGAARAFDGPVVDGKDHALALAERHDLGAGLHARPLLGEDELAAGEVGAGLGQEQGDLQRKDVLAIEVLVQAVVVAGTVAEEERRRSRLAGFVAAGEEVGMPAG